MKKIVWIINKCGLFDCFLKFEDYSIGDKLEGGVVGEMIRDYWVKLNFRLWF